MRIGICEDNHTQQTYIKNLVSKWSGFKGVDIITDTYDSAEEFLFKSEDRSPYDLLLLDIQMSDMTGMELAKKLVKSESPPAIIFITALRDHVFEGYDVGAVHYLVKPIDDKKLFICLDRVYENIGNNDKFIIIKGRKIKTASISYIESVGHDMEIHTETDVISTRTTVRSMFANLDESTFIVCHRSFIVNLAKIERIGREVIRLDGGTVIPVSRGRYEIVNKAFIKYHTGGSV